MFLTILNALQVSIDCESVYYLSMSLTNNNKTISSPYLSNCCIKNVFCVNNRVDTILWYNLKYSGTINSTALSKLTQLTTLDLHDNQIKGPINNLPSLLTIIDLSNNLFTESLTLPPLTQYIYISNNDFSKLTLNAKILEIHASNNNLNQSISIPNTCNQIYLDNNQLYGSLNIPSIATDVSIFNNLLNSLMIPSNSQLQSLYASHNHLNQVLNSQSFPPSLSNVDLSYNQLSGSITLNSVNSVYLQFNQLSGITINDTSNLMSYLPDKYCDLSHNVFQHLYENICEYNTPFEVTVDAPMTQTQKNQAISPYTSLTGQAIQTKQNQPNAAKSDSNNVSIDAKSTHVEMQASTLSAISSSSDFNSLYVVTSQTTATTTTSLSKAVATTTSISSQVTSHGDPLATNTPSSATNTNIQVVMCFILINMM
eukprot:NODE_606_length_5448_cov_0.959806.p1 type:complete len:426 gc:universal NODE_606_length_5448_cov_0.959806:1358-2635(+)